jgi:hypothetical protein
MALFDMFSSKKRLASVKAVEDTELLVIADYAIVELSRKHTAVYEKIDYVIKTRNAENLGKQKAIT